MQAIQQIGGAMIDENGEVNSNALKVRITEQYLDTLSKIYKEVKLVGLPAGSGSSGDGPLSAENIATAMVMFQHVSQKGGSGSISSQDLSHLQ